MRGWGGGGGGWLGVGAYSRWVLIRRRALNRMNTVIIIITFLEGDTRQ